MTVIKKHNFISWFCNVKPISLPLKARSERGWCIENLVSHQEPTEFVRQNLKWCPSTRSLLREFSIVLLQKTSESVREASGISFQEESVSQMLWDKEQGLERKSESLRVCTSAHFDPSQTDSEHTCHWTTNKTSTYNLLAQDSQSQRWRCYWPH